MAPAWQHQVRCTVLAELENKPMYKRVSEFPHRKIRKELCDYCKSCNDSKLLSPEQYKYILATADKKKTAKLQIRYTRHTNCRR